MHSRATWPSVAGIIILTIVIGLLEDDYIDFSLSEILIGTWLIAWSIYAGLRFRLLAAPMIGVFVGLLSLHRVALQMGWVVTQQSWMIHLIGVIILLMFSLPTGLLRRKRRVVWNRWIFSHAAAKAIPGQDGYEQRIVPVRQAQYSNAELRSFADFFTDRGVAVSEWAEGTLYLFFHGDHTASNACRIGSDVCSRIQFDEDGQLSAYISLADYHDCGEVLSYTSLCREFGNIVFDFLQRHRLKEVDLIHREIQDETREAQTILVVVGLLSYAIAIALYLGII